MHNLHSPCIYIVCKSVFDKKQKFLQHICVGAKLGKKKKPTYQAILTFLMS